MDLADVSSIHSQNQNYKYLLFVIDVFSRYLWIQPIKDKTSKSVINALKIVLRGRKPNSIKSDKDSEFKNKEVRSFLKKEDIPGKDVYDEQEIFVILVLGMDAGDVGQVHFPEGIYGIDDVSVPVEFSH
jgi:transposase InsO family protein